MSYLSRPILDRLGQAIPHGVSVVILVKNERRVIRECLDSVFAQVLGAPLEVIVVDSGSTDGTLDIVKSFPVRIVEVQSAAFQFGKIRNHAAELAVGSVLVWLSGDAILVGRNALQALIEPLCHDGASRLAATFGRQIPRADAPLRVRLSVQRIYGEKAYERSAGDVPRYGVRAFHCSNAWCSVLRDTWRRVRFREDIVVSEDVGLARDLLKLGHTIRYVPSAVVVHSHNYSLTSQLKRYFDTGVSYHRLDLFSERAVKRVLWKEGLSLVFKELASTLLRGRLLEAGRVLLFDAARALGLLLGRCGTWLPLTIKRRLSLYPEFWDVQRSARCESNPVRAGANTPAER